MTASNFKPSLALVLSHEGGFVNNPKDPGGATNQGVTQAVYDAYRRYHGDRPQSVKLITAIEVAEIYAKNYWRLVRADSLPCGLDYAVFDFGVNSGVSRAVKYLQKLVGVAADGSIGLITLDAVEAEARRDEERLIAQYCANRLAFLQTLSTFATFGKGWTRRVIGAHTGVQANDTGVIDYATLMARRDTTYNVLMPTQIGTLEGELVARAVPLVEPIGEVPVDGPEVKTAIELKDLMLLNDGLAKIIGASA